MESALNPLPVAKSAWASCNTYLSLKLAKVKQYLNINPVSSNPQLPVGTMTVEELQRNNSKQENQTRAPLDKMSDPKSDVGSAKGSTKPASTKPASPDSSKIFGSLSPLPQPDSDIGLAVKAFKQALRKNWQRPHAFGERGTFIVRGDVELTGPRASCVLEVVADYHPREARYMSVGIGFKYLLPRRQRPRPLPEQKNSNT